MFEEMNNLVNNFIKDIDDVVDNLKLNQMSNEEEITSEQEQEWHEQNMEDGWY
jgi:NAD-specific glutamate dehydrogenase